MESALVRKVNSPDLQREDAALVLGPSCNWQQMLCGAPASIAVLGQVMLIAGQKDFSLVKGGSNQTFNHIRNPESFKASLVQLANAGWRSFNAANTNMDQIRLHTLILPDHMMTVVRTLIQATDLEAKVMLPKQLSLVQRVPEECKRLAEDVEKQFISTMELICELLEASTAAKGAYDEEYQQIKASIEAAKERQAELEERKKLNEEELQKTQKLLEANYKSVKEAIDSIPTGMSAFAMSMLESSMATASNLITMKVSKVIGCVQTVGNSAKGMFNSRSESTPTTAEEKANHEDTAADTSLALVSEPFEKVSTLLRILRSDWEKDGNKIAMSQDLRFAQARAKSLIETLQSTPEMKLEESYSIVHSACVNLDDVIKKIIDQEKQLAEDKEATENTLKELNAVIKTMEKLSAKAKIKFNTCVIQGATPKLSKIKEEQNKELGALETASRNAFYKTEQAKALLENAQAREEQASKNMRQTSNNLHKVMRELSSLNLDEINFSDIRKVLQRGMRVLGQLQQEWSKLVELFTSISDIVKVTMDSNMKAFTATIENQTQLKLANVPFSDYQRDQIYDHMMAASRVNFVVNQLSSAYCEISQKYIMPGVSSLNSLMFMDPEKERVAIMRKQDQLMQTCEDAKDEIMRRGALQSQEFSEKIQSRMLQIETEMSPLFRALPEAEKRQIQEDFKEATQSVIQEERASQQGLADEWF